MTFAVHFMSFMCLLWLLLSVVFSSHMLKSYSEKWHAASRQGQRRCVLVVNVSLHFPCRGSPTILNKLMNFTSFWLVAFETNQIRGVVADVATVPLCTHTVGPQPADRARHTAVSEMPERIKLAPACIICCVVNICYGNFEVPRSRWYDHHVHCWWQSCSLRLFLRSQVWLSRWNFDSWLW